MSYCIVFTGGAELTPESSVETQFLQDFQAYLENHTQPLTPYLTGKGNVIISFPSIAYVTIGDTVAEVVKTADQARRLVNQIREHGKSG